MTKSKCKYIHPNDKRCRFFATNPTSGYCSHHDLVKIKQAKSPPPKVTPKKPPITRDSLMELVADSLAKVDNGEISHHQAMAIAQLAKIQLAMLRMEPDEDGGGMSDNDLEAALQEQLELMKKRGKAK